MSEISHTNLTNVENSTSNFRQQVQVCSREEERKENNGNSKLFCATHVHKKTKAIAKCFTLHANAVMT